MRRAWVLALLFLLCGVSSQAAYIISASPGAFDFGNVVVGNSVSHTFTITNISTDGSDSDITVSASASGAGFSVGAVSPTTVSFPAGPSSMSSATFTVTFTPTIAAAFSTIVTVMGSAQGGEVTTNSPTISLSGTGIPAFTVTPSSLTLPNALLGCSVSQPFTIQPNEPLNFTLSTSPPSAPLALSQTSFSASSATNVTATYTPAAAGVAMGLFVNLNALTGKGQPVQPQTLPVAATGVDVVPSPATLDFGSVSAGATSPAKTVTLTLNPAVSTVYQLSAKSSSTAFAVAVSTAGVAQITFTPAAQGSASGTITFTVTDPANTSCLGLTKTVQVTGTGVAPTLTLSPTSLDFGAVQTGTTSAPKTVTLTDSSSVAFTGTVSSSNPMFAISPASFSVGALASQTSFNVTFAPTATGPQTATITFSLSGSGAVTAAFTTTLTLSATGQGQAPPAITVSPATIDFGNVNVGSSATNTVVVSNTGGAPANVTGSTASPFSLSTGSFTVNAGGTQSVTITFTPGSAGPFQGTATFTLGSNTQTVTLKGTGVPAPAPSLTFTFGAGQANTPITPGGTIQIPDTLAGATSGPVQFQITNSGNAAGTITSISVSGAAFKLSGQPSLPATVPPGGSVTVTIAFAPNAPGAATGTLSINGQAFNLTGNGLRISGVAISGPSQLLPAQQVCVGVTLAQAYSVAISGQLTVSISLNAIGGPDAAMQFATNGTTVPFNIAANGTTATFANGGQCVNQIALQTGTVAGTINLSATFNVAGADVTPQPAPALALPAIPRAAPVIQSVTATKSGNTITAVIVLYATSREVNTVAFQFTAASGANLQTTSASVDVGSLFTTYFNDATRSGSSGGMARLTVPLNVTGDPNAVASLSVTAANGNGVSPSASTNVQ